MQGGGREGGGGCLDCSQAVQLNSQDQELDPGFGLEKALKSCFTSFAMGREPLLQV